MIAMISSTGLSREQTDRLLRDPLVKGRVRRFTQYTSGRRVLTFRTRQGNNNMVIVTMPHEGQADGEMALVRYDRAGNWAVTVLALQALQAIGANSVTLRLRHLRDKEFQVCSQPRLLSAIIQMELGNGSGADMTRALLDCLDIGRAERRLLLWRAVGGRVGHVP